MLLITGSITRSAKRRHIGYSEGDFEVFRPGEATRCTDWDEIWHGGVDGPLLHAKFHPHRCNDKGIGPLKLKLLRLYQNSEQNFKTLPKFEQGIRPCGACPLRDFHEIQRVCTAFQDAFKIWMDLLKGLRSYGSFKWRVWFPQIFRASLAAKLCV